MKKARCVSGIWLLVGLLGSLKAFDKKAWKNPLV